MLNGSYYSLFDEAYASFRKPSVVIPTLSLYGSLAAWVTVTQVVPGGRSLYASLLGRGCGDAFGLFFSVIGGVSAALWISVFAVFALLRHTPTADPRPFVRRVLATRDILLNAWIADRIATIHELFATVVIICGAMLIPNASTGVLVVAALIAASIGIGSRLVSRVYIRTASDQNKWLDTQARPRFARITARLKAHRGAPGLRRKLLSKIRPIQKQIDALQSALKISPFGAIAVDSLVKISIFTLPYNQSPLLSAYATGLLTVVGMAFVFRIATQFLIDIPEAVQGRQVASLQSVVMSAFPRRNGLP